MSMSTAFKFILSLVGLVYCSCAYSQLEKASWGGFLSAGYLAPSANNFYGYESGDNGTLLEAGLNGRWALNSNISFSGLLTARKTGDWFDDGVQFDHLTLNADLWSTTNWDVHGKLGRIKLKNGLFGTTRDVPFTKPSIILPQSVYSRILREQSLRTDGISLDWYKNGGFDEQVNLNLTLGKEPYDQSLSRRFLGSQQQGTFESEINVSAYASYRPNSQWFMSYQYRKYDMTLEQAIPGHDYVFDVDQHLVSLQFSQANYEISSEASYRDGGSFGQPHTEELEGSVDMWAFYVNTTFYVTPKLDLWLRYDHSQFIPDYIPEKYKRLQDIAIGGTWNFDPQWQFKAEYHWLRGASMIPPIRDLYNIDQGNPELYWQMAAVQLSFRF